MAGGIRIDALPASLAPSLSHVLPSMKGGKAERLSVQQIADLVLSLIVDGSPEALNTLNELAAALGDDENFAATVTIALNARMKLDGSTPMEDDLDLGGFSLMNTGNLVGMTCWFPFTAAPTGWLKANGAAISRTTYSELFGKVGTVFGAGDGSTTFNLPDLRGEFLRGYDDGRGIDSGRVFGSAQASALASHSHVQHDQTRMNLWSTSGTAQYTTPSVGGELANSRTSNGAAAASTENTGGSETRPRNIALLACIKY